MREKYSEKILSAIDSMQEEPVSEDFKQFEDEYLDKEKDEILCIYDRHAGLVDGAKWQKEQMMAKAVEGEICEDSCGCLYVHVPMLCLNGFSRLDKVKAIIIKED